MESKTYKLTVETFKSQIPNGSYRTVGDDFVLAQLGHQGILAFMRYPVRFDGYMAFYCIEGSFTLELNLKSYEVSEGSLIIYTPGNIARVFMPDDAAPMNLKFIIAATSQDFMSSMRIDFNKMYEDSLIARETPCISLNPSERKVLGEYYDLASSLLSLGTTRQVDALKSLCSSAFCMFGSIWRERLDVAMKKGVVKKTRSNVIFENFLRLVSEHHNTQHNVSFYAEMLYLTPKYLSKLVKEVSGKSAPEWIDSFIILEAKNLLKYSDMSIKEIAFNMHFSTVPSFYKFFRKHTGMTPAEFRTI